MTGGRTERALQFSCVDDTLLGVVTAAAQPAPTGVLIVVGGPQYRAGSHRQFVQLARALAAAGYTTLRFDVRGMGDSTGALRSFEALHDDIACGIDALMHAEPRLQRVVLWGLCDGASAALMYVQSAADRRVAGLALLNPWVRSEQSLARTHVKHYYTRRLLQADFWTKLLRGGVGLRALQDLAGSLRALGVRTPSGAAADQELPYQLRMAQGWERFGGPILLMISDSDLTAREFIDHTSADTDWQRALACRPGTRVVLDGADHTCSAPGSQRHAERLVIDWLGQHTMAA
jgi:exosortase A-associated hydrolase 1